MPKSKALLYVNVFFFIGQTCSNFCEPDEDIDFFFLIIKWCLISSIILNFKLYQLDISLQYKYGISIVAYCLHLVIYFTSKNK